MSRVYEALRRARHTAPTDGEASAAIPDETGGDDGPPLARGESSLHVPAESEARPLREQDVNAASEHRLLALRDTLLVTCPQCEKVWPVTPGRAWTSRLLAVVGVKDYKCRSCGHRFSRAEGASARSTRRGKAAVVFQTFLRPEDDRSFHEVIERLARDEDAQPGGPIVADTSNTNSPIRSRLVPWPEAGTNPSTLANGSPHDD